MSPNALLHPASYRDPSGFMFEKEGVLYRQVNNLFKEHYDLFIQSGCYNYFTEQGQLIPHESIHENLTGTANWYLTLKPEKIDFISYPYEWSFDMLKDAALLTLQMAKDAITFGLVLKDATPYNVQWHKGRLIFIDSLSFEKYNEKEPWIAYRQFCESFLGPLLMMYYQKIPLHPLLLAYPEGIPLSLVKKFLPGRSRFSLYTYLHIHVHAGIASAKRKDNTRSLVFSKQKMLNLLGSLETLIKKLQFSQRESTWSAYYNEAARRNEYLDEKKKIVASWIDQLPGIGKAADLGANDGEFSKLLALKQIDVLATHAEALLINNLYLQIKTGAVKNIQPLILDLSTPTPAIGVNNEEHSSFLQRCQVHLCLALALVHHLAIGKNIPFEKIATFFAGIGHFLVIEFIPKDDEKIQLMLAGKKDIYTSYTEQVFLQAFETFFQIVNKQEIGSSGRILYLLKKK